MAALSDYLEARLLDFIFKANSLGLASPGDNLYVALFTGGANLEAGGFADEIVGNAYARVQVPAAAWDAIGDDQVQNNGTIDFPVATGTWGNITHVAIVDAATVGNILFHGALASTKNIAVNDQFRFFAGDLVATLS